MSMQSELFNVYRSPDIQAKQCGPQRELNQFFTPEWAALRIIEEKYPHLGPNDFVVEPTCGTGAFVKAIPHSVPLMAIEVSPVLADFARENTGRDVLCADFRTVQLPQKPTLVVGNPPWTAKDINDLFTHYGSLMDEGGEIGMIIPDHNISYTEPVLAWARTWSIIQTKLPTSLFPRLSIPINFVQFRKERIRRMVGFLLYDEAEAIKGMSPEVKMLLVKGQKKTGLWRAVVVEALRGLGGRGSLAQIYSYVEGRRPRVIRTWRDTIRRVLQEGPFERLTDGTWLLEAA